MKPIQSLRDAWLTFSGQSHFESELDEELRSHIRDRVEHLQQSGMGREDAERQARIEFGAVERYKEECRESAGTYLADSVWQDVRYALRLLRRSPGFTAVAVATLAIGIGANSSMFSLIDAVLLRPLPYPSPSQLLLVTEANPERGVKDNGCSYPDMIELRKSQTFTAVAGVNRHGLTLTGAGEPMQVDTVLMSPEMFPLLGEQPIEGRYLLPSDERKGSAPTVVMSEHLWRSRFASKRDIVGTSVMLDDRAFTVVGIMPEGFRVPVFGERQDIWIPITQDPLFGGWTDRRGGHWLRVVARMRPHSSVARSQAQASAVSTNLARQFPAENGGWEMKLRPLHKAVVADVRTPLLILATAVGLLLLLTCINVANLLLARSMARSRELLLRQALGAGRQRIVRQLLTESAILTLAGATAGLSLAYASIHLLPFLLPPDLPAVRDIRFDPAVFAFTMALACSCTLLFGAAPALILSSVDLQTGLRDSAARSGSSGPSWMRVRHVLAAGELAFAAVLVIGAGLLARSLVQMLDVNPGFRVQHILKAEIDLPRYRYTEPQQWTAFESRLLERVQALPGLTDAAIAVPLPLSDGFINLGFDIPNHAPPPPGISNVANYVSVSPNYFQVMGIRLLHGRLFSPLDAEHAPKVTIVSEAFARNYFHGEDPIGKTLKFGFPPNGDIVRVIVGVASNVRDSGLTQEAGPIMYVPFAQAPFWGGNLVVHTEISIRSFAADIRQAVRQIDPNLLITGVTSMPEVIASFTAQPKLRTGLLAGFGMMALLIAALGVFGLLSYSVAMRTREFGVRSALGASRQSIALGVLLEGLGLGLIGVLAGLAGAGALVRFLRSELFGITAYDPAVFAGTAAILLLIAALACYLPARRAMQVDPIVALRSE